MPKKITTDDYVERAKIIHKDLYLYDVTEYAGMHQKLQIRCKEHGIFEQTANDHLLGSGCQPCSKIRGALRRTSTVEDFVKQSAQIHNNKYDYANVEYINAKTPVKIRCPIHGVFNQCPSNHLFGQGCYTCSKNNVGLNNRVSVKDRIIESNRIFNSKYDYSLLTDTSYGRVDIICPIHGKFKQDLALHSLGHGCRKCGTIASSATRMISYCEFVNRASAKHSNFYVYDDITSTSYQYLNAADIDILCPLHGRFAQNASSHLQGHGCKRCAALRNKVQNEWLDYCGVPDTHDNRQVRVTISGNKYILDGYIPSTNTVYEFNGDFWHGNPNKYNQDDINPRNKKTYGMLFTDTVNKRYSILSAGYTLIEIWESEWAEIKKRQLSD